MGLSQIDFGSAVGVSQPTVANWENGSHAPRPVALSRISNVLDVDQSWLLSGTLPTEQSAALPYLQIPTRHVPVYKWPANTSDLTPNNILSFTPFATEKTTLIGLQSVDETNGEITVELFDFNPSDGRQTRAGLVEDKGELKRVSPLSNQEQPEERILKAKLEARLTFFR